jgi:hypothetical protein
LGYLLWETCFQEEGPQAFSGGFFNMVMVPCQEK